MAKSGQFEVQLYDYDKLNTNSLFRRLMIDTEGQQLHEWHLNEEEPTDTWKWIQT